MDRPRQPAMRPAARGTRRNAGRTPDDGRDDVRGKARARRRDRDTYDDHGPDDDWPAEHTGGVRTLLQGFAVVRWILLVFAVGFGIAAVIAIALAALFALVNASV